VGLLPLDVGELPLDLGEQPLDFLDFGDQLFEIDLPLWLCVSSNKLLDGIRV